MIYNLFLYIFPSFSVLQVVNQSVVLYSYRDIVTCCKYCRYCILEQESSVHSVPLFVYYICTCLHIHHRKQNCSLQSITENSTVHCIIQSITENTGTVHCSSSQKMAICHYLFIRHSDSYSQLMCYQTNRSISMPKYV